MALPRRGGGAQTAPPAEKKKPVMSFKVNTDRTTTLEVAIWENTQKGDNGEYSVHSVSVKRSYRKEDGSYAENNNYRPHDLPVLLFLVNQAYSWILGEKTTTPSV